jgi:hypothetical protein
VGEADGYAAARPGDKWIDPKRWARARDGVPIGNGRNFGFVRSKHTDGGVEGDHDLDGVPNLLDVDENGNKILDRYEHPSTGKAARVSAAQEISNPAGVRMTPGLALTLKDSLNADAMPDLKLADVDNTLANFGFFWIVADPGNTSVELDCGGSPDPNDPSGWIGGLRYCTRSGTGRVATSYTDASASAPRSWPLAFPDCCDTDGNGFGELGSLVSSAQHVNAYLSHGATTAEVGTGDVLNWKVTSDGVTTDYPTLLEDMFATDPALASYDDGTGAQDVSYPVLPPYTGSPPSVWGGDSETHTGFPVSACSADAPPPCVPGHVVLTFTFWRPQRPAIGSESGDFADIGNSVYSTAVSWPNHPCPQDSISTDDPSLTPAPGMGVSGGGAGAGGFRDPAPDQPPDPDNTLSFSVDATECLNGEAWNEGGSKVIQLVSTSEPGVGAGQGLYFTLTG